MTPYSQPDAEADIAAAMRDGDWDLVRTLTSVVDALDVPQPRHTLGAALWYAEVGLRVFPCQPMLKVPYARTRGVLDASSDPAVIQGWWERWPESNVAIATGHLVDVIDFDGAAGHAAWGASCGDTWGGFTVLATVSTPRPGGMHVYVRAAGEGNRAGMFPSVDYRGRGGYVIAPPSLTNAGTYRFLRQLNPEDL